MNWQILLSSQLTRFHQFPTSVRDQLCANHVCPSFPFPFLSLTWMEWEWKAFCCCRTCDYQLLTSNFSVFQQYVAKKDHCQSDSESFETEKANSVKSFPIYLSLKYSPLPPERKIKVKHSCFERRSTQLLCRMLIRFDFNILSPATA